MTPHTVDAGLAAFTMTLLCCDDHYLMLRRGNHKAFAPGRWTGIGGRVEPDEFDDIHTSALREISEETGYQRNEIEHLVLRRSLIQQRPGHPVTVLFYFTGDVGVRRTPTTDEGSLHWVTLQEFPLLDVIENTRLIIPLLIEDRNRDPQGSHPHVPGASFFDGQGNLNSLVWAG